LGNFKEEGLNFKVCGALKERGLFFHGGRDFFIGLLRGGIIIKNKL